MVRARDLAGNQLGGELHKHEAASHFYLKKKKEKNILSILFMNLMYPTKLN